MLYRLVPLIVAVAGCAQAVQGEAGTDASSGLGPTDSGADASATPLDAMGTSQSDAPPATVSAQLLLTEVVLTPTTGELIELSNPSGSSIDLSTYYLTDAGAYFRLPSGAPTLDSGDFIAKFPAGATIAAHSVITVALDTAANFQTTYAAAPTFALSQMTLVASTGAPTLTNAGELVVLFTWDGAADNVRDVDIMIAGVPTVANSLVNKSGIVVDGPDANTTGTAYKTDAVTLTVQPTAPGAAKSTKRLVPEATHENHLGTGNGIDGDDETSENTAQTWDTTFTAPTPGSVPAGLQ